jgi:molybdopterin/thiamine biosynthesis adenylyltransferase
MNSLILLFFHWLVILYLAACGVGNLAVVDFDEVDMSNLHRQVIHRSPDIGLNKAESAGRAVHDLNPTISCLTIKEPLTMSMPVTIHKHGT